ncbi:MAG TPA: Ig-like domain-containing protein [Candidatus Limnocylindrales bacterium]|nr:Ig-like domain-containing protein [Candidatus Limnocylindrales bacterium]
MRRRPSLVALLVAVLAVGGLPPAVVQAADPVANPQAVTTGEDVAVIITLTGSDPDDQALAFAIPNQPDHGSLGAIGAPDCSASLTCSADVTYTPAQDYNGPDSFTFSVADGPPGGPVSADVTITVTPAPDDPLAVTDTPAINEDAGLSTFTVLSNDSDPDGDSLSVTAVGLPSNGTTSFTSANVRYTPDPDFNGQDSFTYTISDGNGGTDIGTVNVTVTAVNDAPSFTKGANQTVAEDAPAQTVSGWATDLSKGPANESGQTLTFVVTNNNNPLFASQPAISPTGTLTYTPAAAASGVATVTVTLQDSGGTANGGDNTSDPQTFTITVTAVNDAPSFIKGPDQSQPEVGSATPRTVVAWATGISAGPVNEAAQILTFSTSNNATNLFSAQPAVNSTTGTLTYTQAANRSGVATVTVTLSDNGGTANGGDNTSDPQTFTITIEGTNNAPTAANDAVTMPEGAAATAIPVLANDSDFDTGDVLTIDRVTCGSVTSSASCATSGGTVTIIGGGTGLTFRPAALFDGPTSFVYRVNDGHDATDTAAVLVTVTKDTIAPVIPSAPTAQIYTATTLGTSTLKVRISWPSTTDAGSGIEKYHLQRRVNGGSWASVATASPLSLLVAENMATWSTYEYRVRAKDREGNVGPFVYSTTFQPIRYQEASASIVFVPAWVRTASTGASGGYVRYTYTAGQDATFTFTGKAVAWVAPKSTTRGSADVTIDGVLVGRYSQRYSSVRVRQTIMARSFAAGGVHTIKIDSAGGGRIDIDCIVILR